MQAGSGLAVQPPPQGHLYGLQEWDLGVLDALRQLLLSRCPRMGLALMLLPGPFSVRGVLVWPGVPCAGCCPCLGTCPVLWPCSQPV